MPNWCANQLTLTHDDPAMIQRAHEAFKQGEFLNEFIPVPKELTETIAGSVSDLEEKERLEAQQARNIKLYGYSHWYDFCVSEWGTKWDVGDESGVNTVSDDELTVTFDSAWSPPTVAYSKLMDMGFTVYALYYEPGCAFAGVWDDGFEDHFDLSGMDSRAVQDQLPTELDEAFSISEVMADYEALEQDEVTTWYKDGVEECGLTPHTVKENND